MDSPTTPHLRVVGDDDDPPGAGDQRPVGLGLDQVGGREPGPLVDAVHAQEERVDVQACAGRHGDRADQRVGRRPDAAGEDDGLVGAAAVVQQLGHRAASW